MDNSKQPRQPTSQERRELIDHLNLEIELSGRDEDQGQAERYVGEASISVFDHYVSADRGYSGKVMVVVWAERLECYEVYIWRPEGLDRVTKAEFYEIL